MKHRQAGFTVLELVIYLAITVMLGSGILAAVSQTYKVNAQSSEHMEVVQQLESAGFWLNRDVLMAQVVAPSGPNGFPLQVEWISWNGALNQATYTLTGDRLRRSFSINGGTPKITAVAGRIDADPSLTNGSFSGGVLTLRLTAAVGDTSETRVYQIRARPEAYQ